MGPVLNAKTLVERNGQKEKTHLPFFIFIDQVKGIDLLNE